MYIQGVLRVILILAGAARTTKNKSKSFINFLDPIRILGLAEL